MNARWMFNILSSAGAHARLTVLIFHRVLPAPDPLFPGEVDAIRFETQMRWIKSWFNVCRLRKRLSALAPAVCLRGRLRLLSTMVTLTIAPSHCLF